MIHSEPCIVLLRGISGSGKTTSAKKYFSNCDLHAADDYFEETGHPFTPEHKTRAHKQCQDRVRASLQKKKPVCVHNTNTTFGEMFEYFMIAQEFNIPVHVYHVKSSLTDEELAARNLHGLTAEMIAEQRARWQPYVGEVIVEV